MTASSQGFFLLKFDTLVLVLVLVLDTHVLALKHLNTLTASAVSLMTASSQQPRFLFTTSPSDANFANENASYRIRSARLKSLVWSG